MYGFWLLWYALLRASFIAINGSLSSGLTLKNILLSFFYGAYMDVSMASYWIMICLLLFFLNSYLSLNSILFKLHMTGILIVSALSAGDVLLYREWGYRLDRNAFLYLQHPETALSFITWKQTFVSVFLAFVFLTAGVLLYKSVISPVEKTKSPWIYLANVLIIGLVIIPLRGGLGIIPMNPGKVYFSNEMFTNHAALNLPWNLMYSIDNARKTKETVAFMTASQANLQMDSLMQNKNLDCLKMVHVTRPKILLLVLESFTSNLLFQTYKDKEITPQLNARFKTGLFFSNAYATGVRTEMGIASILSGFPAQPRTSIVNYPEKTQRLPSLIRDLKSIGYHTRFFYGGDAAFASMSSYFFNSGCDEIMDRSSFPPESYNAKWGVHDHILFDTVQNKLLADTSQWFSICLSLSSHPPYHIPVEPNWKVSSEEDAFLSSAHYTDASLGTLLNALEQSKIWQDLLVVIVADHGARLPGNVEYHVPERFHIPIWFGGGIIKKDSMIHTVVSQNDIAPSICYQLGLDNSAYKFGNNLFSRMKEDFAYYAFNNGFGWVDSCGTRAYSFDSKNILFEKNPCSDMQRGKAYAQKVLTEFEAL